MILLAYGSPLPSAEYGGAAAVGPVLTSALMVAETIQEMLLAPETLLIAEAALQGRLSAAVESGGAATAGCPFARLRALRSPALRWEEAWKHGFDAAEPPAPARFRWVADRMAWARALGACAESAEAAAAVRTVSALSQLAPLLRAVVPGEAATGGDGSSQQEEERRKRRDKLTYAAVACVGAWSRLREAVADGARELAAAEAAGEAARGQAEATVVALRKAVVDLGGRVGGEEEEEAAAAA